MPTIADRAVTDTVLEAKAAGGFTYEDLSAKLGRGPVYLAAAFHRQASLDADDAAAIGRLLDLDPATVAALQVPPVRGADEPVPSEPLAYRLYEAIQVYGPSIKAVVNEMFGDGIVSAIDFELRVDRKEDPKGDRVVLTFDGKFLPYRRW
jgi:cyanate lyase